MNIRVAQVRIVPSKGDLEANHAKLMQVLLELGGAGADVVVTPECFLDGYVATEERVTRESIRKYAVDPSRSRFVDRICVWARNQSAWVVLGCSRLAPEGVYNSAVVIDREGRLVGWYDKTHCQTHDRKFVAGTRIGTFDSDFGPFGAMICADRRWPETVRTLALRGARVIFNPTYGMHDERNLHMMQTRSYESEVFIAFTHPEQSLMTDPRGAVVCNDTGEGDCSVTEIDLSVADAVRAGESAHLKDRRPELYER